MATSQKCYNTQYETRFVACVMQVKGKEGSSESFLLSNAFIRYCN